MNWLDVVLITIGVLGAAYGLTRGVLRMVTSVLSLFAAIYVALLYYPQASALLVRVLPGQSSIVRAALGYAIIFGVVFVAIELSGVLLMRLVRTVHLGWLDRLGGGIFGLAVATAIAGLGLMVATALLPAKALALRDSLLAPHVLNYTEASLDLIPPQLKEAYREKRQALAQYWLGHLGQPAASPSTPKAEPSASPVP